MASFEKRCENRVTRSAAHAEKQEETIFEIVNQLNRGSHLNMSIEELEHVAELNFRASA